MTTLERPTYLGGELQNLAWEDLRPHEITLATAGSALQAELTLPLVDAQINASLEFGDVVSERAYRMTRHTLLGVLGMTALPSELAQKVKRANEAHSVEVLSELARISKVYVGGLKDSPYHPVLVMSKLLAGFNDRTRPTFPGQFTLLSKDYIAYRKLLDPK